MFIFWKKTDTELEILKLQKAVAQITIIILQNQDGISLRKDQYNMLQESLKGFKEFARKFASK